MGPWIAIFGGSVLEPARGALRLGVFATPNGGSVLEPARGALGVFTITSNGTFALGVATLTFCLFGGGCGKSPGRFLLTSFTARVLGLVFRRFAGGFGRLGALRFRSKIFRRFGAEVGHSGRATRAMPLGRSNSSRSEPECAAGAAGAAEAGGPTRGISGGT